MTSLGDAVAKLRKSGAIVSGDSPLAVRVWDRAESANLLERALQRSFAVNLQVLDSYPPFTHGRDGKVLRRRQRSK